MISCRLPWAPVENVLEGVQVEVRLGGRPLAVVQGNHDDGVNSGEGKT